LLNFVQTHEEPMYSPMQRQTFSRRQEQVPTVPHAHCTAAHSRSQRPRVLRLVTPIKDSSTQKQTHCSILRFRLL